MECHFSGFDRVVVMSHNQAHKAKQEDDGMKTRRNSGPTFRPGQRVTSFPAVILPADPEYGFPLVFPMQS